MATSIYFNTAAPDPQNAVCLSEVNTGPSSMITMVLGSKLPVNLYFVDGSGDFDAMSGTTGYSVKAAIGKLGQSSTGGTYTLTYGANTTSALAYNADADAVETALNLLASIIAAGGVTVSGTWPVLVVTFNNVGARNAITGTQDALTPTSAIIIDEFQVGDASTVSKWGIENAVSPPVYQTSWTQITNGWTAVLDLSTFELAALLAGVDATTLYFEVRITDPDGNPRVWGQPFNMVRNRVINPGALAPAARDSYLTAAEVRDGFVQNRYLLTGLTGGTSADLDSIPTAGAVATEGWMAAVVIADSVSFYRLEASTQAESSPDWIRPDDYNGTTNQRVWHLVSSPPDALTDYTDLGSFNASVVETVQPAAGVVRSVYDLQLGTSALNFELVLGVDNPLAGDAIWLNVSMPASGAVMTLTNDGPGTAAMGMFYTDPSGVASFLSMLCYFDGTDWYLFSVNRLIGGIPVPVISGWGYGNGTYDFRAYAYWKASTLDAVIGPNGLGAFMLQVPDGGTGGGNARGNYAVDLQLQRTAATQVASGANSIVIGDQNTASNSYSWTFGSLNQATTQSSLALGLEAKTTIFGQFSFATGKTSAVGDTQTSLILVKGQTTNATPTEIYPSNRVALPNNTTWQFTVDVCARRAGVTGGSGAWRFSGCISRDANLATTAIIGTVQKEELAKTDAAWDFDVEADAASFGSLKLTATGEAAKTITWAARVQLVEITG